MELATSRFHTLGLQTRSGGVQASASLGNPGRMELQLAKSVDLGGARSDCFDRKGRCGGRELERPIATCMRLRSRQARSTRRSSPGLRIHFWLLARQSPRIARIADWRIADWSSRLRPFAPSEPLNPDSSAGSGSDRNTAQDSGRPTPCATMHRHFTIQLLRGRILLNCSWMLSDCVDCR